MKNNFALITGASQGLGLALAEELAKRKYNLLLVSLPNENLSTTADEIENIFGVTVKYFETDMTEKSNVIALSEWANAYDVSVLINNAGSGGSKQITEVSLGYIEKIIQLNVTSTALLTKLLLPNLIESNNSYIMNVSSMAAFSPMGYKTVYPASKKFIDHFSMGLREELKEKNVSVTVIYPGPMKTNEEVTSRIESQSKFVNLGVVELDEIAEMSISKMFKGKRRVIPGRLNRISKFILDVLPLNTKIKMLSNAMKKEIQA
ncbi:SDR family NAD(P)-dependent oxidoreductase [uncultured Tenacibaculum sp.]|uniref:SDR family NAD(P)-dependent oxidoreductase n=1 Tax=uncultured Tenacibaculum sp. TaxID=174713 RepID=UPI002607D62B|nr:SDR family NAD(P)-dependent oxidoreductase [uncultured Tenacibaculum sp.]